MWNKITQPFYIFNGAAARFWEWISNFLPRFIMGKITYPCWDWRQSMQIKRRQMTSFSHDWREREKYRSILSVNYLCAVISSRIWSNWLPKNLLSALWLLMTQHSDVVGYLQMQWRPYQQTIWSSNFDEMSSRSTEIGDDHRWTESVHMIRVTSPCTWASRRPVSPATLLFGEKRIRANDK